MRTTALLPLRRPALAAAAATFVLVLACGDRAAVVANEEVAMAAAAEPAKVAGFTGLAADATLQRSVASARGRTDAPSPQGAATRADSAISTMLIRTGDVSVRVDSLEPAIARLRQLAASLGGVIGNVAVFGGEHVVRSATIELRIPADRFDAAMAGVQPIGEILSSQVGAQDVGEEFVDVRARVANGRRLEARLVELVATRTGKLEDVLAVERELARVREEIERSEGRMRWLGARVATSTIQVHVSEPAPIVGQNPGQSVLGQAFVQAWRNFIGFLAAIIASLGVVVPVGLVVWLLVRGWRARLARSAREA